MRITKHASVFALTLALAMPGMLLADASSDQTRTRKEALHLTRSVERTSRQIQKVAEELDAKSRSGQFSNKSHQHSLNLLAMHINEQLQPTLKRLAEIQPDLPVWHQDAIDQMRTAAATLAASANAAIETRNDGTSFRAPILDANYRQLIDNMSGRATALTQVADATGDYASAQLKGHSAGLAITSHD